LIDVNGFTFSFWINASSMGEEDLGTIWDNRFSGSGGFTILLRGVGGDVDTLQFSTGHVAGSALAITVDNTVTFNETQQFVVFMNGTTRRGIMYRNGVLLSLQTDDAGGGGGPGDDSDNEVRIGNRVDDTTRTFDGVIDEIRVSNGSRSADWINASYFNGVDDFIIFPDVTAPVGDTCDYTSGDFVIDCSEECTIDADVDVGGNDWIMSGAGTILVEVRVHNFAAHRVKNGCYMRVNQGNGGRIG